MKTIKVILFLIIMPLLFLTLTSCKVEDYEDMKHIYHEEILTQKESEYYVYVYRYNCAVCERIKEDVIYYYNNYKKHDLPRLYVLNKGDTEKNQGINSEEEKEIDFLWTRDYRDIQTAYSPCLIKVRDGQVVAAYDMKTQILEKLTIENK